MEKEGEIHSGGQAQVMTFTEGQILLPLVRFALPVLAALFLQAMYGAVDLMIVGRGHVRFADHADTDRPDGELCYGGYDPSGPADREGAGPEGRRDDRGLYRAFRLHRDCAHGVLRIGGRGYCQPLPSRPPMCGSAARACW